MANIYKTMPINVSVKPGIIENIMIGADCSLDEVQTYTALFGDYLFNCVQARGHGRSFQG